MMFSDAEHVQTSLVSKLHLFEEMLHALDGLERETGGRVGDGCCEAVDADLHLGDSLYADGWMIMLAFGHTPQRPKHRNNHRSGLRIKSGTCIVRIKRDTGVAAVILPGFL